MSIHVNYADPGLSREHFEFVARRRVRTRGKGGRHSVRLRV